MQLIRAYDLNPLIYLELQHSYLFCHTNAFVSPRRNKLKVFPKEKQMNESQFYNIAIRDDEEKDKLRVVKVIHAIINKRIFIFYQKPQIFKQLSSMIIKVFNFKFTENQEDGDINDKEDSDDDHR